MSIGLRFPFLISNSGSLDILSDTEKVIRQNVIMMFRTELGSRIMRPELGLPLRRYFGEPLNEEVSEIISEKIQERLNDQFSDQIRVTSVEIPQRDETSLYVIVNYRLRSEIVSGSEYTIEITIQ